jgi:hypothetical protein
MIVKRAAAKFVIFPLLIVFVIALVLLLKTTPPPPPAPLIVTSESSEWIENQTHGVNLEIDVPAGWQGRKTEGGIVIAEHASALNADHQSEGIQAHVFVRLLTEFQFPLIQVSNEAWWALKQIADDRYYTRGASVSEPYGFEWGGHDAAYYLLNDGRQKVMLILAITPASERMVTFSISSPWDESQTIRGLLPDLLSACKINGQPLDPGALDHLPDPLVFPEARPTATPQSSLTR